MKESTLNKYRITAQCIGCRACVDIAANNFEMNTSGKADVMYAAIL